MALMAAHGEIKPMPDYAIFADTGAEPLGTYEHLRWMKTSNVLPFTVYIVKAENIREVLLGNEKLKGSADGRPPFFVIRDDGGAGMLNRQCTSHYKLKPLRKKQRELAGLLPGQRSKDILVTQWIGISLDEAMRAKPSRDPWCLNRFPLLDLRISRRECIAWLRDHGYPVPPKSACTFCPFRDDLSWRNMKKDDPVSFEDACKLDDSIRNGMPGVTKSKTYVHRSLVPLRDVDLSTAEDRGQLNLFINECEGMCGV